MRELQPPEKVPLAERRRKGRHEIEIVAVVETKRKKWPRELTSAPVVDSGEGSAVMRRASSKAKSPEKGQPVSHSPSRGKEGEESRDRRSPHTPSQSPFRRSPKGSLPSCPSGLTNAQKRAIPPPPKPPPVRSPREPDYPPPGYSSWAETDVRSKSQAYDPPPNKGKKKDERNHNLRLWREYERGYY